MPKIPTILFSGGGNTPASGPTIGFGGPNAIESAGQSIDRGLQSISGGLQDVANSQYRATKEEEHKLKERKTYDNHLWSEQQLTEAQRKWAQWTQDVQKNGSENVVSQFDEQYKQYKQDALKNAPNPEAANLLGLKLDDLGTQVFKNSLTIEAGNKAQNTINTFTTMLSDSTDLIAQVPEAYASKQKSLNRTLELSLKMGRITPEIGQKIKNHIENLAADAAEAMIPSNPARAREIIDGAKGIDWARRHSILNEISRAENTNDTLNHYQQQELAKSNFESIMQTGKPVDRFNIDAYAASFPEKSQMAARAEAESQIKIAQNVYVGTVEMHGKSQSGINEVLVKHQPQPGSADYADKFAAFTHLLRVADNQQKLLKQDPFTYARQDPVVDGAWKLVESLPQDATPAMRSKITTQALDASIHFQKSIGVSDGLLSVMSTEQARAAATKINTGKVDEVQNTFAQMAQNYGPYYQTAFRDLMRLPDGQRIDGTSQVVALHLGKPFLTDFIQAMRTPSSDFKTESPDRKTISERLALDENMIGFQSAILSGNPGGASYVDDFRTAIDKYSQSLLQRGKAKNPTEAVDMASKLIIGSAYNFVEVNGNSVAVKLTQGNTELTHENVDTIGNQLRALPAKIPVDQIDTRRFMFPPNLSPETIKESVSRTLSNDSFWVTNPANDGAILFINGVDGTSAPVKTKQGKPIEYKFDELLQIDAADKVQSEQDARARAIARMERR